MQEHKCKTEREIYIIHDLCRITDIVKHCLCALMAATAYYYSTKQRQNSSRGNLPIGSIRFECHFDGRYNETYKTTVAPPSMNALCGTHFKAKHHMKQTKPHDPQSKPMPQTLSPSPMSHPQQVLLSPTTNTDIIQNSYLSGASPCKLQQKIALSTPPPPTARAKIASTPPLGHREAAPSSQTPWATPRIDS
eukprot:270011_1